MSDFAIRVLSPRASERIDAVEAFVGEDASGQFALRAHHERFLTVLEPGLSRVRLADGHVQYLAQSGAVAHFVDNELTLACRDYLWGEDADTVGQELEARMAGEELALNQAHDQLEQLEREMLRRLWRMQREAS